MATEKQTTDGLMTLMQPKAEVPETRFRDAQSLQDLVRTYSNADLVSGRSSKRALVQGLVDGNPPYKRSDLIKLGRKNATNINPRTGKAYLMSAEAVLYDLFSEAPTHMLITCGHGTPYEQAEYSRVMTEIAHEVVNSDPRWDFIHQMSIHYRVLHGCGPLFFETPQSVIPRFVTTENLKVDDETESETAYWDFCALIVNYKPDQLYDFVRDPVAAQKLGWRVKYTRWAIMNAVPISQNGSVVREWEFWQRQYKQGSYAIPATTPQISVAHCFWREFDGTISEAIVERETCWGVDDKDKQQYLGDVPQNQANQGVVQYLYFRQSKYKDWKEVVHPMYLDKGNGYHYTVNGLGVDMYGLMDAQNRLFCNALDKAMSPNTLFQPGTDTKPELHIGTLHDWGVLPAGWKEIQVGIVGRVAEQMEMIQEIDQVSANNFAQYRQRNAGGGRRTAEEYRGNLSMQFSATNTMVSRAYAQADQLYTEVVRRLCQPSSDALSKKFKEQCKERGLPDECLKAVTKVEAWRVAGQGSPVLRQQAMGTLAARASGWPEDGKEAFERDLVAAFLGQRAVQRYLPTSQRDIMSNSQEAIAMLQVASAKVGTPPIVAPEMDAALFASIFLGSAGQALGSVAQGADPLEVLRFVHILMPAAAAHIQRLAKDEQKQALYKHLMKQLKQVGSTVEKFEKHVSQNPPAPRNGQGMPPMDAKDIEELNYKKALHQLDLQKKSIAFRQRAMERAQAHQQRMEQERLATLSRAQTEASATDLRTAAELRSKRLKALNE